MILIFLMSSSFAESNKLPLETYMELTEQGIEISIAEYCQDYFPGSPTCQFKYKSINLNLSCEYELKDGSCATINSYITINSTIPIKQIIPLHYKYEKIGKRIYQTKNGQHTPLKFKDKDQYHVQLEYGEKAYPNFYTITVSYGKPDNIFDSFVLNKKVLDQAYDLVLERTLSFQSHIAKSHQGHLDRYVQSLKDGIAILNDEKEYSLLDWRVLESSRRIMVFGIVAGEILEDYGHVPNLQGDIDAITTLTKEIRRSYGWGKGLAGDASKAGGALLELMEFELSEIVLVKIAAGFSNIKIYTNLMKEVKKLMVKVNTSKSGDMAAQRGIFTLLDAWNSNEWQKELKTLIEAKPDFKKLIAKKLNILLMAVQSMADLSNMDFENPAMLIE